MKSSTHIGKDVSIKTSTITECVNAKAEGISAGTVHKVPVDLRKVLLSFPAARQAWEDITPLARNEWICWIKSAKKAETRSHRIKRACTELIEGKCRPCCWPGCPHR
ncbi:YdeI/OmpD-associated family protein [Candidatus Woesearchaeota archaeon]|nr:YdeI/OmpD-associated family protein [Candidatus Woesearchaeota archaeon]